MDAAALNALMARSWRSLQDQYASLFESQLSKGFERQIGPLNVVLDVRRCGIRLDPPPALTAWAEQNNDVELQLSIPAGSGFSGYVDAYLKLLGEDHEPFNVEFYNLKIVLDLPVSNVLAAPHQMPTVGSLAAYVTFTLAINGHEIVSTVESDGAAQLQKAVFGGRPCMQADVDLSELNLPVKGRLIVSLYPRASTDGSAGQDSRMAIFQMTSPLQQTLTLVGDPPEMLKDIVASASGIGGESYPRPWARGATPQLADPATPVTSDNDIRQHLDLLLEMAKTSSFGAVADRLNCGSIRCDSITDPRGLVAELLHPPTNELAPLFADINSALEHASPGIRVEMANLHGGEVPDSLKMRLRDALREVAKSAHLYNKPTFDKANAKNLIPPPADRLIPATYGQGAPNPLAQLQANEWLLDGLLGSFFGVDCTRERFVGDRDSAIWTGHLLAGEAFHYGFAVTTHNAEEKQKAIDSITWLLERVERNVMFAGASLASSFQSAADTELSPQSLKTVDGMPCRCVIPTNASDRAEINYVAAPGETYQNQFYSTPFLFNGTEMVAFGRGTDGPSRDQIIGLVFGLSAVVGLADQQTEDGLRKKAAAILLAFARYIDDEDWNIRTPDEPFAQTPTPIHGYVRDSYLCQFHHQHAIITAAARAEEVLGDPDRRFRDMHAQLGRSLAEIAWLPSWLDGFDTINKYYKFNLAHAALAATAVAELDPVQRAVNKRLPDVLRTMIGHHRNAFFNLAWVISRVDNAERQAALNSASLYDANKTLNDEISQSINELMDRHGRVKGVNGLPSQATPDTNYLEDLKVANHLTAVADPAGGKQWLANSALAANARPGSGMDFIWQRNPFGAGITADGTTDKGKPTVESPGIDLVLVYWMYKYCSA